MRGYPAGNATVLGMIESGRFDSGLADDFLYGVDINAPICDLHGYSTTYLYVAVSKNNLPAVKYFLEHGADPNLYIPELISDCALWDLQYLDIGQNWETRYEISKLFFQYGANPNIKCDGETLYDYVLFKVYNDTPRDDDDWENLRHFYKLLVLYGGGEDTGEYPKPRLEDIDPKNADEYDVILMQHEDGYHIIGKMVDDDGNVVGDL